MSQNQDKSIVTHLDDAVAALATLIEDSNDYLTNMSITEYYENEDAMELSRVLDRVARLRFDLIELGRRLK